MMVKFYLNWVRSDYIDFILQVDLLKDKLLGLIFGFVIGDVMGVLMEMWFRYDMVWEY